MVRPIDLHVHSTCSDGTLLPSELVDLAIKKNLSAFALTDHDTVAGISQAISYSESLRRKFLEGKTIPDVSDISDIPTVIPGIELSTEYQGQDVHIVGLYIDTEDEAFQKELQSFIDAREIRNQKMCALFREHGIPLTYEILQTEYPDCVLTRAHYARYLFEHGYTGSVKEGFDKYLGDRCCCFVPREKVTPVQAVEMIRKAGGVPVLAHPILYHMSDARLDTLVSTLKDVGLRGIEAIYSTYKPFEERQIRSLAAKYDLAISGGSDFHGSNKPKIELGTGLGNLFVPSDLLNNLMP